MSRFQVGPAPLKSRHELKARLKRSVAKSGSYRISDCVRFLNSQTHVRWFAESVMEELNTPMSLRCYSLLRSGSEADLKELFSSELNVFNYDSAADFARDLQAVDLLRKLEAPLFPCGVDRRAEALKKAESAEQQCKQTNTSLEDPRFFEQRSDQGLCIGDIFRVASEQIDKILGDFDLDEFVDCCGFGPGVSDTVRGAHVSTYNKFLGKPSFTQGAADVAALFMELCPLWSESIGISASGAYCPLGAIVRGNVITTVPKTVLTDRTIAIEPNWMIFFQKGLGIMIRRRLRRWGIDLSDQSMSQMLAAYGSITGQVFTIDLKSASDTVARLLVRVLFRPRVPFRDGGYRTESPWLKMLEALRSPESKWEDGWRENHKFSSMGNGFTFELESLIFYAISRAVCLLQGYPTTDLRVYGDDITGPSEAYDDIVWALTLAGFTTNGRKSFNSSPFRESCGGNYFYGIDVTPVRVSKLDSLASWYALANGLGTRGLHDSRRGLISVLKRFGCAVYGPACLGDVVLHTPHFHLWKVTGYHGRDLGHYFWAYRLKALKFVPSQGRTVEYAAAVLHSIFQVGQQKAGYKNILTPRAPVAPDAPEIYGGRYALRKKGRWKFGDVLVDRVKAHES